MDKKVIDRFEKRALWSERELGELCCGLIPNDARPNTDELNDAEEDIRLAIFDEALPCKKPIDADKGDRLYGHARFIRPEDAIPWASAHFEKFPDFSLGRVLRYRNGSSDKETPLSKSTHWLELERKANLIIQQYPEVRKSDPRLVNNADNTKDWIKATAQTNDRDALFLKKVLSDIYPDAFKIK